MEASNSGANKNLLHDSEINKRKLIDSIRIGDIKTAKQLIGEGINVNFILDDFAPLHAALKFKRIDMLELLLCQPNIDLNISNERVDAPLLWSLKCYHFYHDGVTVPDPEEFVLRLIRAGCDITRSNKYLETPLHLCVNYGNFGRRNSTVVHELLKRGAHANAQNFWNGTALDYAIVKEDLEVICMLLYYNADVFIKNKDGHTPFSLALHLEVHEIAEVLSNYCSFLDDDDDVNYIIDNDHVCVVFSKCTNAEQFKAVWSRFDPELILCKSELCHCFINCYMQWYTYSTSDWVECLYLILNSDIAFDLIDCKCYNFLCELLRGMRDRHVQSEDRIGLIYMVLSLGAKFTVYEFNYAVATFGLNQNLEPFIYSITYSSSTNDSRFFCPLHAFVIGMETDYSVKKITQLFHDALKECIKNEDIKYDRQDNISALAEIFAKTVAFFSFSADAKDSLMSIKDWRNHVIMDEQRLQEIPEFPSLMELCRNQIHKYLVQKFKFKQPYQLQDCVKKLLIPNKIKDIILFKEPIY